MKREHFSALLLCLLLAVDRQIPVFAVEGSDAELTAADPATYPTDNWVDLVTDND